MTKRIFLVAILSLVISLPIQSTPRKSKSAKTASQNNSTALFRDILTGYRKQTKPSERMPYTEIILKQQGYVFRTSSGKLVKTRRAKSPTVGIYAGWARVTVNHLDVNMRLPDQNADMVLRYKNNRWREVMTTEGVEVCARDVRKAGASEKIIKGLGLEDYC